MNLNQTPGDNAGYKNKENKNMPRMEKLIVLEGNCGDEGQEYKKWLEKNLPNEVELDFRDGCCGVGGGLFDDEGNEMDNNIWWTAYCDS